MSFTVKKYPQGTFSWADLSSSDIEASKKFLTDVFGWTSTDMPAGNGLNYTMFYLDGKIVAGGGPMPQSMKGMRSFWNNYVTVDNVDSMAKKAVELGGTVVMPGMDVLDAGRMVGIQDPTGASVMLWQPKKHIGAQIINVPGAMSWNELYTTDMKKAQEFYSGLLGWEFGQEPDLGDYTVIKNKGRKNGGVMLITKEMMGMPPCWVVYFTVKNIDEANTKVKKAGGTVHLDTMAISVGKISMAADPTGASFMMLELSVPADDWIE